MWFCILTSTLGASHPLFLLLTLLSKRGLRYLVLRLRLALRNSLRALRLDVTLLRGSAWPAKSSLCSVVADKPMCLLPASTPNVTGCVFDSVTYKSLIVNGQRFITFAFPVFSNLRTLPYRSVGISGCPSLFCTYTTAVWLLSLICTLYTVSRCVLPSGVLPQCI